MPFHSLLKEIARFEQCEVEVVFATFETAAEKLNLSQRDTPLRKLLAITVIECVRSGEYGFAKWFLRPCSAQAESGHARQKIEAR
jgi:hypothetical protein